MKIGFIGLGNVGHKLASNLLQHRYDMTVPNRRDLWTRKFPGTAPDFNRRLR